MAATTDTLAAPGAVASTASVSVNFGSSIGPVKHVGSGFLYGLDADGSGPADRLLAPLSPNTFRAGGAILGDNGWIGDNYSAGANYEDRIQSALKQAQRVTAPPYNANFDLLVSDLYGADGNQPAGTVYPCANGDCSNWVTFIDQVVSDVKTSGVPVSWDIWNEPDVGQYWQPGFGTTQYYAMWDTAVHEIRRLLPSAQIVGPSESNFSSSDLQAFLAHVKANSSVPNVLNWHFGEDPVAAATTARSILSTDGISGVSLSVNEYLTASQQTPGFEAFDLARFTDSGISRAEHAIWTGGNGYGLLDQLLTQTGRLAQPTGNWWLYERYASEGGTQVATSGDSNVDLSAAYDSTKNRATVLLGSSASFTGTATLAVSGIPDSLLFSPGQTYIKVERIQNTGNSASAAPQTVSITSATITNGSTEVAIPWSSGDDAYFVTISPEPQTFIGPDDHPDLALNQRASMLNGTPEPNGAPANAVDGSDQTFGQANANVLWVEKVDLGQTTPISKVTLNTDYYNYPTAFTIQSSTDGSNWTTDATESSGSGGIADYSFAPTVARYVELVPTAVEVHGDYGYGLRGLSVYDDADVSFDGSASMTGGTPFASDSPPNAIDENDSTYVQSTTNSLWNLNLDLGAAFTFDRIVLLTDATNYAQQYSLQVSSDDSSWTTVASETSGNGTLKTYSFNPVSARYVRTQVTSVVGGSSSYGHATRSIEVLNDSLSGPGSGAVATMSGGTPIPSDPPSNAIDGSDATYAQSNSNSLWGLNIDLGRLENVDQVYLLTDATNYAHQYTIQGSSDGSNWTTLATESNGDGTPKLYSFTTLSARYIRVVVTQVVGGSSSYGHAIRTFAVLDR